MDGILLIDKPSGWTSFDVVAKVRSVLRAQLTADSSPLIAHAPKVRVGHTGTLDPLATGLLVLVVGSYTKRAAELSKQDKVYEVTMKLGATSTTGDEEGEKTVISGTKPSLTDVEAAVSSFIGEIEQIPPRFSAIKVDGQRAYKLARAGKTVKLEPRKITVYSLQLTAYHYPEVTFIAKVSSGTYIRSLVEDIGTKLGTGAYMSALRRTEVGAFNLQDALQIAEVDADLLRNSIRSLL